MSREWHWSHRFGEIYQQMETWSIFWFSIWYRNDKRHSISRDVERSVGEESANPRPGVRYHVAGDGVFLSSHCFGDKMPRCLLQWSRNKVLHPQRHHHSHRYVSKNVLDGLDDPLSLFLKPVRSIVVWEKSLSFLVLAYSSSSPNLR